MKQVMKKAWEIAKEGQKKFGGKVKEYFSIALKMAWEIVKKGAAVVKNEVVLTIGLNTFDGMAKCFNKRGKYLGDAHRQAKLNVEVIERKGKYDICMKGEFRQWVENGPSGYWRDEDILETALISDDVAYREGNTIVLPVEVAKEAFGRVLVSVLKQR